MLLGPSPGHIDVEISEDHHVDVGEAAEILQIGIADHAGADETHPDGSSLLFGDGDGCPQVGVGATKSERRVVGGEVAV